MRIYFEYNFPDVPQCQGIKPYSGTKEDAAEIHSQLEMILNGITGLQQSRVIEQEMKERMWYILKRLDLADEFTPTRKSNDNQDFSF